MSACYAILLVDGQGASLVDSGYRPVMEAKGPRQPECFPPCQPQTNAGPPSSQKSVGMFSATVHAMLTLDPGPHTGMAPPMHSNRKELDRRDRIFG